MTKKMNILNNVFTLILTFIALFVATFLATSRYYENMVKIIAYFLLGGVFSIIVCTVMHELGHALGAKINGFSFLSFQILFFKWSKSKGKTVFSFAGLSNSAGCTEFVSKSVENIEKRYKKVIRLALVFSAISILFCLVSIFVKTLPLWAFSLSIMFLPMGVYSFFDNALPMVSEGVKNDGALLLGLKQKDDSSKVMISLLKIQSELFNGKTPSEVSDSLYFDLPQLREDDLNYFLLLKARYDYYLDKRDYENAKKTTHRLLSLEEYSQKSYMQVVKVDALYNACTFDFDENLADDLTYELESFLNNVNTATNIRAKLAYILNVRKETDGLDSFYEKGVKEAKKSQFLGYSKFECKLLEELYSSFMQNS